MITGPRQDLQTIQTRRGLTPQAAFDSLEFFKRQSALPVWKHLKVIMVHDPEKLPSQAQAKVGPCSLCSCLYLFPEGVCDTTSCVPCRWSASNVVLFCVPVTFPDWPAATLGRQITVRIFRGKPVPVRCTTGSRRRLERTLRWNLGVDGVFAGSSCLQELRRKLCGT